MYNPSFKQFAQKAKHFNLVPVWTRIKAHQLTPLTIFEKIYRGKNSYLLESASQQGKLTRYSFIATKPRGTITSYGEKTILREGNKTQTFIGNPLDIVKEILAQYQTAEIEENLRFHGGAVGYLSYDIGRFIEKLPDTTNNDLNLPDLALLLTDTLITFDHLKNEIIIINNAVINDSLIKVYEKAIRKIETTIEKLENKETHNLTPLPNSHPQPYFPTSNFTQPQFEQMVQKTKKYIAAGDIYQANLSQRFALPCSADPFNLYKTLRQINPSPFASFLDLGETKIVSSSPERLILLENQTAETRPIAGTRPHHCPDNELLLNKKERAEHIMLVDLERNDLGRACQYNTVKVDEIMVVEKYSHVIHIVSNVTGKINKEKDQFDLFKATFPGGTITGTPKIRAMEIIEELEPVKRGPYTGTIGYFGYNGNMDMSITIRTIVSKNNVAYIQAGAGIVADSVPEREYHETLHKAEAMLEAVKNYGSHHLFKQKIS